MRAGDTAGPRPPDCGSVWREGTVIVGKVLNPAWRPPGTTPALLHLPSQQNGAAKGKHTDPRFGQLRSRKWVLTAFLTEQVEGFSHQYTLK